MTGPHPFAVMRETDKGAAPLSGHHKLAAAQKAAIRYTSRAVYVARYLPAEGRYQTREEVKRAARPVYKKTQYPVLTAKQEGGIFPATRGASRALVAEEVET